MPAAWMFSLLSHHIWVHRTLMAASVLHVNAGKLQHGSNSRGLLGSRLQVHLSSHMLDAWRIYWTRNAESRHRPLCCSPLHAFASLAAVCILAQVMPTKGNWGAPAPSTKGQQYLGPDFVATPFLKGLFRGAAFRIWSRGLSRRIWSPGPSCATAVCAGIPYTHYTLQAGIITNLLRRCVR